MPLYSRDNARRSLIDTAAFRALSQLATMAGYVVMVRGMTREDFGVFNLLYAFIPVVSTVASLGLEQVLRRYQPEYLKAGNLPTALWLVRFVSSARFGTNMILLGAILLLWNYVAPIFKLEPYRAQFAVFGVLILLHFQARILQLSLAAHMLHRFSVGSMAALAFVKLALYGVLFWLDALTLDNAIFADIAAYATAYMGMRIAYRKLCFPSPAVEPVKPDAGEQKRLMRYGLYNNFNDAGTLMLNSKTDNFFIAAFIDPVSVGIYAFYTRLNEMASNLLPTKLFENVVQPLFFSMGASSADQGLPRYFSLLTNLNLLLLWPFLAFSVAYHGEFVTVVFGGKFVEYSWLLPTIAGFSLVNGIAVPVTMVAQYKERASIILMSKIVVLYNVAALVILIPRIGIFGAAIASGSAQVLKNLFIWWFVRETARWLNGFSVLMYGVLCWGGAVCAGYAAKELFSLPDAAQLLVGVILCGLFWLIYVRTPALSGTDRSVLKSLLRGREESFFRRVGLLRE